MLTAAKNPKVMKEVTSASIEIHQALESVTYIANHFNVNDEANEVIEDAIISHFFWFSLNDFYV